VVSEHPLVVRMRICKLFHIRQAFFQTLTVIKIMAKIVVHQKTAERDMRMGVIESRHDQAVSVFVCYGVFRYIFINFISRLDGYDFISANCYTALERFLSRAVKHSIAFDNDIRIFITHSYFTCNLMFLNRIISDVLLPVISQQPNKLKQN